MSTNHKIESEKKKGTPKKFTMYINNNKNDNIHKNEVQNIGFGISIKFPSQRGKKFKLVQKQRNYAFI